MWSSLKDLLTGVEFMAGLYAGLIALVVALPLGLSWRYRTGDPSPFHGALLSVAVLLAISRSRQVPGAMWVCIALLVLAGSIPTRSDKLRIPSTGVSLLGALWLAMRVDLPGASWMPWLGVAVIVVGGRLVAEFDQLDSGRSFGPSLWLLLAAGVVLGLPDTEEALVLLGAAVPLVVLGWPTRLIRIGHGAYALLGVFVWIMAWGGRGRPSATIAVTACLGVLVVEPLVAWLNKSRSQIFSTNAKGAIWAGVTHAGIVLAASRWGGPQTSIVAAAGIAAVSLAAGTVLTIGHARSNRGPAGMHAVQRGRHERSE